MTAIIGMKIFHLIFHKPTYYPIMFSQKSMPFYFFSLARCLKGNLNNKNSGLGDSVMTEQKSMRNTAKELGRFHETTPDNLYNHKKLDWGSFETLITQKYSTGHQDFRRDWKRLS